MFARTAFYLNARKMVCLCESCAPRAKSDILHIYAADFYLPVRFADERILLSGIVSAGQQFSRSARRDQRWRISVFLSRFCVCRYAEVVLSFCDHEKNASDTRKYTTVSIVQAGVQLKLQVFAVCN
jgi:hypothetical protein